TVVPGAYVFRGVTNRESQAVNPPIADSASADFAAKRLRRGLAIAGAQLHAGGGGRIPDEYSVVWWDPHILGLDRDSGYGLRRDDLIVKDGDPAKVAARLAEYEAWRSDRDRAVARAAVPSLKVRTATSVALDRAFADGAVAPQLEVLDLSRSSERPFGPRFGTLVHATLAIVPLDAGEEVVAAVAQAQGRILPTAGSDPYAHEEVYAAVEVVS